jgi:hypothetical protein
MTLDPSQFAEILEICPAAREVKEGDATLVLLHDLRLPDGCQPATIRALLWPAARDGYSSRLFFSQRITPVAKANQQPLNWNANGVRILEENWHAFSWQTRGGQRLAQMIGQHLQALR